LIVSRKEAQRCFCCAPNCRGWIGGDENEEEIEADLEEEENEGEAETVVVRPKVKRRVGVRKRKKTEVLEDKSVGLESLLLLSDDELISEPNRLRWIMDKFYEHLLTTCNFSLRRNCPN